MEYAIIFLSLIHTSDVCHVKIEVVKGELNQAKKNSETTGLSTNLAKRLKAQIEFYYLLSQSQSLRW